jgi:large subunit ribosomal protein L21
MYAIIRAGGKQARVSEGDVIAIERIKSAGAEVTFTPLLVVQDDGTVISERAALDKAKVVAEVLGESRGDKVEVFKYKPKTGYRRRQGHRQTYTTIQVKTIETGAKAAPKKAEAEKAEAKKPEKAEAKKPEKAEAKKPEKAEAKKPEKAETKKPEKKKAKASPEEKAPKKAKAPKGKDEAATEPKAEASAAETAAGDEEA